MFHTDEGVIEALVQAVSLLCAEHDVGDDDDFEMLVQGSAEASERVRKVAATIVRQID